MKKWKVILVIVGFVFLIAMVTIALTSCSGVSKATPKLVSDIKELLPNAKIILEVL
jgi:flagellar basal body-associated protein FliL